MDGCKAFIGLEIHIEVNTKSKLFCGCPADHFGKSPNSQVCPVCLGMPGALPVPNNEAFLKGLTLADALNCEIGDKFIFARKHYFYPDLPKGYQITQFKNPLGKYGHLDIECEKSDTKNKKIRINRVHLEEDAGKLKHLNDQSLIDFNRAGVPLLEVVTEPDFDSSYQVLKFLKELQLMARYIGISDADMEKGQMRLEPNISVLTTVNESSLPDYKVEVKNINSFKYVEKAIKYEIKRQVKKLQSGKTPKKETRGFDSSENVTYSQRNKEDAVQYRYFPEPDIPPVVFAKKSLHAMLSNRPELPASKRRRLRNYFNVPNKYVEVIVGDLNKCQEFELLLKNIDTKKAKKLAGRLAKLYIEELTALRVKAPHKDFRADYLAELIVLADKEGFSYHQVKNILRRCYEKGQSVSKSSKTFTKQAVAGEDLKQEVKKVLNKNSKAVKDVIIKTNPNAVMFLVGQVMQETEGKADPVKVKKIIDNELA